MARYLVLLKFNSQQNAYNFVNNPYNSAVLGATEATVPSGFIGPSGPSTGIGQPSSSPSSGYTYVDIYVSSTSQIPRGYYSPNGPSATQLILDLETRTPVYVSPNIDPNSITLQEGDNTIINKGIPSPDWTPPDPTLDSPIEFKPIYYPGQDQNEFYKQYLQQIADFPSDPNVMRDPNLSQDLQPPAQPNAPIEQFDLPPIPIPGDATPPGEVEIAPYMYPWDQVRDLSVDRGILKVPPDPFAADPMYSIDPNLGPKTQMAPDQPKNINYQVPSQSPSTSGTGGLQGVHFDGATGLFVSSLSTLGTSKVSFSGWVRSAWKDSNPPLFIVDPGNNVSPNFNNNDPQVEAVGGGGGFVNILVSSGNVDPVTGIFSLLKSVVTTTVKSNIWQHFIGTVDGSTGNAAFLVNGVSVGSTSTTGAGPQPFSTSPTNGKPLYIGLDTLFDFFTGDMAAFGVWMDVSFLSGSSIPQSTINLLYNNGIPIIPFGAAVVFGPPTVFLTGPASRALSSPISGTQQLFYSQGQLTTSAFPLVLNA